MASHRLAGGPSPIPILDDVQRDGQRTYSARSVLAIAELERRGLVVVQWNTLRNYGPAEGQRIVVRPAATPTEQA